MDLSAATNQPLDVTLEDGRKLQVFAGTVRQMGRLQAWLNNQPAPGAKNLTIANDMPPQVVKAIADAMARQNRENKDWPPEVASAEGWRAITGSDEGKVLLLKVAFEKTWPEMSNSDADSLIDRLTWQQFQTIALHFFGFGESQQTSPKDASGAGVAEATQPSLAPPAGPPGPPNA
jgi:hypothetical protein